MTKPLSLSDFIWYAPTRCAPEGDPTAETTVAAVSLLEGCGRSSLLHRLELDEPTAAQLELLLDDEQFESWTTTSAARTTVLGVWIERMNRGLRELGLIE